MLSPGGGKFPQTRLARHQNHASSYLSERSSERPDALRGARNTSVTCLEILTGTPEVLMMPGADHFWFCMKFKF